MGRRATYLGVVSPDRVDGKTTNSAVGSIDTVKLDAEVHYALLVVGSDVGDLADRAERFADVLDGADCHTVIDLGELVRLTIWIGIEEDRKLHLAFELVEVCRLLRLGHGILVG